MIDDATLRGGSPASGGPLGGPLAGPFGGTAGPSPGGGGPFGGGGPQGIFGSAALRRGGVTLRVETDRLFRRSWLEEDDRRRSRARSPAWAPRALTGERERREEWPRERHRERARRSRPRSRIGDRAISKRKFNKKRSFITNKAFYLFVLTVRDRTPKKKKQ